MYTLTVILITAYTVCNIMLTIFAHYTYADRNEKIMIALIGLPLFIIEFFKK